MADDPNFPSAPQGSNASKLAGVECDSEDLPVFPDRLTLLCRPIVHGLAGPFTPQGTVEQYQQTIRPPHSKFHPVPTRPAFAPPIHDVPPAVTTPLTPAPFKTEMEPIPLNLRRGTEVPSPAAFRPSS